MKLVAASALALLAAAAPARAELARDVFGYAPYWTTPTYRWDLLTHVGWFSAEMNGAGEVTNWRGWDDAAPALIAEAHAHGVKVVLVVTIFDAAAIHGAITDGRATAIAEITGALERVGADGVNLDFEGVAAADADALVSFTADLRAALPDAHISLATPAVDWSDAWRYAGLATHADHLMIMAYDYHWRGGGTPGPVAPLVSDAPWGNYDVTRTVDEYLALVDGEQLLLGMPLYGYDWPAEGPDVPGVATGQAEAVFYATAEDEAQAFGRLWDDASMNPYYLYGGPDAWHQVWYDDPESLGLKMDLAVARDLGGIGLWALGYESETFWPVVEDKLTAPPAPDAGLAADASVAAEDGEAGCGCRAGARSGGATGGGLLVLSALVAAGAARRTGRGRRRAG